MQLEHEKLAEEIILLKASNGEMFTAHDVTRAVRHQVGPHVDIPHHEVRLLVHNLFEKGQVGTDYARSLVPFPGANPVPFVYHRTTDDPATYKRPDDSTLSPSPFTGNSITVGTPPPPLSITNIKEEICHADARDTLCVPAKYIKGIGLAKGYKAYVWSDPLNSCAVLSLVVPDQEHFEYTVDHGHNVRITQHCLSSCGQSGKKYAVGLREGIITIKKED
jgi:hypothetical protein